MAVQEIRVPDIGSDAAEVIEILVKPGDDLENDQSIVVLESAKATMEVPSPLSGRVQEIHVSVGTQVHEGDLLLRVESEMPEGRPIEHAKDIQTALREVTQVLDSGLPSASESLSVKSLERIFQAPDIGSDKAQVIEILVRPGDRLQKDQPVMVLESAKATMEVPMEFAGTVTALLVKVGDYVCQGTALLSLLDESTGRMAEDSPVEKPDAGRKVMSEQPAPIPERVVAESSLVHAGPAVRRLAREQGVDLSAVPPSGPKGRVLKEDVHAYVKLQMTQERNASPITGASASLPIIDFAKWGEVESQPLTRIQRLSAQNLSRAWATIPHVTQFDEADISELETFRLQQKDLLKTQGINLTLLAFLVRACAHVLQRYPRFNSSLSADGETLIVKKYIHIGVAVDTPRGLVVPVIREADKCSIGEIAQELGGLSEKARAGKLLPAEMQGATFTISSLGGVGGTAFTPIVNWPEVAILGVSKSSMKPVWDGQAFVPKRILPISLSYDHRVIDGANAARFTTALSQVLADIRTLLL